MDYINDVEYVASKGIKTEEELLKLMHSKHNPNYKNTPEDVYVGNKRYSRAQEGHIAIVDLITDDVYAYDGEKTFFLRNYKQESKDYLVMLAKEAEFIVLNDMTGIVDLLRFYKNNPEISYKSYNFYIRNEGVAAVSTRKDGNVSCMFIDFVKKCTYYITNINALVGDSLRVGEKLLYLLPTGFSGVCETYFKMVHYNIDFKVATVTPLDLIRKVKNAKSDKIGVLASLASKDACFISSDCAILPLKDLKKDIAIYITRENGTFTVKPMIRYFTKDGRCRLAAQLNMYLDHIDWRGIFAKRLPVATGLRAAKFEEVAVRDIKELNGVTKPTIYHYYDAEIKKMFFFTGLKKSSLVSINVDIKNTDLEAKYIDYTIDNGSDLLYLDMLNIMFDYYNDIVYRNAAHLASNQPPSNTQLSSVLQSKETLSWGRKANVNSVLDSAYTQNLTNEQQIISSFLLQQVSDDVRVYYTDHIYFKDDTKKRIYIVEKVKSKVICKYVPYNNIKAEPSIVDDTIFTIDIPACLELFETLKKSEASLSSSFIHDYKTISLHTEIHTIDVSGAADVDFKSVQELIEKTNTAILLKYTNDKTRAILVFKQDGKLFTAEVANSHVDSIHLLCSNGEDSCEISDYVRLGPDILIHILPAETSTVKGF